ncbi:apolipoprotein A1/A4/E family protein, partial [Desulfamplus magnetovallimortis]|uniref:apolipoprotein A1/A4/E family protein n=1 Tax=Desulfamplus magnetovallimortis TaxID=1246637 RepID=UPI001C975E02
MKIKSMLFIMLILTLLYCLFPSLSVAVEVAPHISDREITEKLAKLEAGQESLRSEMKAANEALSSRISDLREEMKSSNEALRSEMKTNSEALRSEMKANSEALNKRL